MNKMKAKIYKQNFYKCPSCQYNNSIEIGTDAHNYTQRFETYFPQVFIELRLCLNCGTVFCAKESLDEIYKRLGEIEDD